MRIVQRIQVWPESPRSFRRLYFVRKMDAGRRSSNYPLELRERAIRMVAEMPPEYLAEWPTIKAVASRLGHRISGDSAYVVRRGRAGTAGPPPGTASHDHAEIRRLRPGPGSSRSAASFPGIAA